MASNLKSKNLNLFPCPRSLKILRGTFSLPKHKPLTSIKIFRTDSAPNHAEGYALIISKKEIQIQFRETGGLRAATATLRQLLRQFGKKLPCLKIRDWPDFARRSVMLDISRGRVPKLATLLDLAEKLSDFKINELQLYTEHTFAYRNYKSVWQSWGALTAKEIQILDARCRELGIDLVPNQNSFGHLREFLAHPKLKKFAEVFRPYDDGEFVRRPTTLAPNHPGTIKFLRGLYGELLPNFSSQFFNVGCDETWDLGRGQSKKLCERFGKGAVYLDFVKKIHGEISAHGKTMMFWGDIILKYPKLISQLPKKVIALNWGYEASHPFVKEAAQFAKAKIPFYVCPGTSTWQTLIGKNDNALANLHVAANAGKKYGAVGYLITDWGDGGHPQPLAVSWPIIAAGAAISWNSKNFNEKILTETLARDIFGNSKIANIVFKLGFVHEKLGANSPNETPLGTVITAPPLEHRELFCRNGLKWFAKIPAKKIRATLKEIEKQIAILKSLGQRAVRPKNEILRRESELAARMAAQSCKFMLWQQAIAAKRNSEAKKMAQNGIRELNQLQRDFNSYWPLRNKATPKHCAAFLQWRIDDYRRGFVK
jgi:hexosaminidase